jgi:hypothetical protein
MFIRLVISHLKSICSKKSIFIWLSIIVCYIFIAFKDSNVVGINTFFSTPFNLTIHELTTYIVFQLLIIIPVGNLIYIHLKYRALEYMARIGNKNIWYLSLLIACYAVVLIIYTTVISIGVILIIIFKKTHTFFTSTFDLTTNLIFINILTSFFIVSLLFLLVLLTKKSSIATLLILLIELITVSIGLRNNIIAKFLPFTQNILLDNFNLYIYSYINLFVSTIVIVFLSNLLVKNCTYEILNARGES